MVGTSLPVRKSLTWTVDDGRGRDPFRGNMSTSVAPNGRCHNDPKLMPMPTPGPTTSDDAIAPARKVPGLAFGRCTEPRGRSPEAHKARPRRRATKQSRRLVLRGSDEGETYELFGQTYDQRAMPVEAPPFSPPRSPLASILGYDSLHPKPAHGGSTTFLTAERKTMLSLKPNTVVSPGPVYDLRTRLGRDVRLVKPAAFAKERKFEQARFEGTYRPPSFTPGPLTHEPYEPPTKPCSVLMIPQDEEPGVAVDGSLVSA